MSGPLFLPERLRRALAACGTALALAATLAVQVPAAQAQAPELAIAVKDGSTSFVEGSATGITYVVSITNSVQFSSDAFIDVNFSEEGGPWNTASGPGIKTNRFRAGVNSTEIDYTINDNMDMGGGSVTATVVTVAGENYTVNAAQASVTVTIVDDDLPAVSITADDADNSVAEGSDVVFTISSTDMPAGGLAVPVTVSQMGNYAASGATGERTVNIPAGGSTVKFTVASDNDNTDEDDGSITATIGTLPATHAAGTMNSATVAVTDDEGMPLLQFPGKTVTVADTADEFVATFSLIPLAGEIRGAVSDKTVTIDYMTEDVSAIAGTDYVGVTSTLTFLPGENTANITVDIIAPDADEDVDVFWLRFDLISRMNLGNFFGGAPANPLIVQIVEKPSFSIVRGTLLPRIPESGSATFTVSISLPQSGPVVVPVTVVETGNMLGQVPPSVTIPAGEMSVALNIPLVDDKQDEADSTVTVSIGLPTGSGDTYALGVSEASLTVEDNDDPVPTISATGYRVGEGGKLIFMVSLDASPNESAPVTVRYRTREANGSRTNGATAVAGQDYYRDIAGTLTFTRDASRNQALVVRSVVDTETNTAAETVILTLHAPTNARFRGMQQGAGTLTATGYILEKTARYSARVAMRSPPRIGLGETARFQLIAEQPATVDTPHTVTILDSGGVALPSDLGPRVITMRQGATTATFAVRTRAAAGADNDPGGRMTVAYGDSSATVVVGGAGAEAIAIGEIHQAAAGQIAAATQAAAMDMTQSRARAALSGRQRHGLRLGRRAWGAFLAEHLGGQWGYDYRSLSTEPASHDPRALPDWGRTLRQPSRALTRPHMPKHAAFTMPLATASGAAEGGEALTVWRQRYHQDLRATEGPVDLDGDITGSMLGMDMVTGDLLMGLGLHQAAARLDYQHNSSQTHAEGGYHAAWQGLHPYFARHTSSARYWGGLGLERGDGALSGDTEHPHARQAIALLTMHGGAHRPLSAGADAMRLGVVSDGAYTQVTGEHFAGKRGLLRLGLELAHTRQIAAGYRLDFDAGAAMRGDYHGHAADLGLDVNTGLSLTPPQAGLSFKVNAHAARSPAMRAYGLATDIAWRARANGRGLTLSLTPQWGATASQRTALWQQGASGLQSHAESAPRYALAIQYGLGLTREHETLTLFARDGYDNAVHHYRLGADYQLDDHFTAGYEAVVEPDADTDHRATLRYRRRF